MIGPIGFMGLIWIMGQKLVGTAFFELDPAMRNYPRWIPTNRTIEQSEQSEQSTNRTIRTIRTIDQSNNQTIATYVVSSHVSPRAVKSASYHFSRWRLKSIRPSTSHFSQASVRSSKWIETGRFFQNPQKNHFASAFASVEANGGAGRPPLRLHMLP